MFARNGPTDDDDRPNIKPIRHFHVIVVIYKLIRNNHYVSNLKFILCYRKFTQYNFNLRVQNS